jgi:hypothetical protein
MEILKKTAIFFIISLAVFACVEKNCYYFFDNPLYTVENINTESNSDNPLKSESVQSEVDVIISSERNDFNLNNLTVERVVISESLFPENQYFSIWQPPKVS